MINHNVKQSSLLMRPYNGRHKAEKEVAITTYIKMICSKKWSTT